MRRDCVTQVIVQWENGEWMNFATPLEAEQYINYIVDDWGVPTGVWLEDMSGNKKWNYDLIEDPNGIIKLED